jgi:hypothetical protein
MSEGETGILPGQLLGLLAGYRVVAVSGSGVGPWCGVNWRLDFGYIYFMD